MTGSHIESGWQKKQQEYDDDGESSDNYVQLFRNEVVIRVVEKFLGSIVKAHDDGVEKELSIASLSGFDECLAVVVMC